MALDVEQSASWLAGDELDSARQRLPIVYLNLVPVRTEANGNVSEVGFLLTSTADGELARSIITGRVLYGELIRDAIVRHVEKDLGAVSLPLIPPSVAPFGVFEYFPDVSVTGLRDPRQHAVALGYVISVRGDCLPSQDALDLVWLPISEVTSTWLSREMTDGQGKVVKAALAHCGHQI